MWMNVPLRESGNSFCSFVPERSCNCSINQTESPKLREHVMEGLAEGCDHIHIMACVCVCVCVWYAFSIWEMGNYLEFAEKANLSLSMVLKLQYTAGAAYKKACSTFCACVCVCAWWKRRRKLTCLCVCVCIRQVACLNFL